MKNNDNKTLMGMEMMSRQAGTERIYAFSDGVFAIIITIMIIELKKPASETFQALIDLWPTWLSYCVSYLFIAIVWINHHFLMKFAVTAKLRLMWANFAHLFCVSLIPFLVAAYQLCPHRQLPGPLHPARNSKDQNQLT